MNERYRKYLDGPQWKAKRKAVKERCKGICERCHKYLVDEVHHLTYEHIFNEPLEDLQGLCKPCHNFLHRNSGIDPLVRSVQIKVAFKVIEYWDSKALKFRRVSIDKLPAENFQWSRLYSGGKLLSTFLTNEQTGLYEVPMDVFLDSEGNPVFQPSRWEKYKTAFRHGRGWTGHEPRGRSIPPDPELVRQEVMRREERKEQEERRQQDSPECFTSYQDYPPQTPKEARALFKRYPRIVDHGCECTILEVRETKTRGVVLDLQHTTTNGWILRKIYGADRRLAEGQIILDHERKVWVAKDQGRRPAHLLANG
jgi:hypothetical protein